MKEIGANKLYFPETPEEARLWKPIVIRQALAQRVLVVARTRIEGAWAAYIDACPGMNHEQEIEAVLDHGNKVSEDIARLLFGMFEDVPYAP